ncbi:AP-3 complex subunit beta-2 [Merluccius polli]|uniref:AP-3 complex subunit beta-2 n=1 Tax=Merluccius polli TaxID=89951 RepID=A0AA47NPC4_MERPO|nr:AP-3 complex subunit beta-2 [Merluccius polli]
MQPEKHSDIIKHMAKLTDNIQVPMARASILWLIGEYCEHVPKIAPDVLRKMAKSFTNEEDIVKLQIINLAAKLYLTNSKQTKLLTQYVLNLAKYDQNYDIRDRARFIRQLIVPTDKCGALSKYAKKLFLALKPAPVLESPFKDRDHFQLGSLSHLLNTKAGGYQELPDWPQDAPDPSVRNVEVKESVRAVGTLEEVISTGQGRIGLLGDWREVITLLERVTKLTSVPEWTKCSSREKRKEKKVEKPFYSDSEGESGPTESADSESDSASSSASASASASASEQSASGSESDESGERSDSEEEDEQEEKKRKTKKKESIKAVQQSESEQSSDEEVRKVNRKVSKPPPRMASESESEEDEDSPSDSSQSESEDSESEAEVKKKRKITPPKAPAKPAKKEDKKEKKEMSLLDLDDFEPTPSPQVTPVGAFLSNSLVTDLEGLSLTDAVLSPATISPSSALKSYELLHRITGEGLWVEYCFSRQPFIHDPHMVAVQIQFTNSAAVEAKSLRLEEAKLQSGMRVKEFPEIEVLPAGESATVVMGIDFCDSTQAANLQLCTHTRKFFVSIQPPVGELMIPSFMTENEFKKEQGQLMGMNEITEKVKLVERCHNEHAIVQRVTAAANLSRVPCGSDKECRFAGRTVTSGSLVLVTVATKEDGPCQLTVNCEKMVIGTMLVKDILLALTQ